MSYVNKIYGARKCVIIQYYKFLRKKSGIFVWTFFHDFFGCNVPPFGILDECSSDFNFTQSEAELFGITVEWHFKTAL
jgi:hypothetical protein